MKAVLGEVLREFYEFGIPEDVKPRAETVSRTIPLSVR